MDGLPLFGGLQNLNIPSVMSLKLDVKLATPFRGTEEDYPAFETAFFAALLSKNLHPSMLELDEGFDEPLRQSNAQVYNLLDAKIYAALVGCVDREQVDVMYLLMTAGVRGHGRQAMRELQQRYQPRTLERRVQLEEQLSPEKLRLLRLSPRELVAKMRFIRQQLANMGAVVTDATLLSRLLLAMPVDNPGYLAVTAQLRASGLAQVTLADAEARLQAEYEAQQQAGARPAAMLLAGSGEVPRGKPSGNRCYWCNVPGHFERECKHKRRGSPPANGSVAAKRRSQHGEARGERARGLVATALAASSNQVQSKGHLHFIADSGANNHIVDPQALSWDIMDIASGVQECREVVTTANGPIHATHTADLHFLTGAAAHSVLRGVLLVPGCGHVLYSCTKLAEAGGTAVLQQRGAHLLVPDTEVPEEMRHEFEPVRIPLAKGEGGHFWFSLVAYPEGAQRERSKEQRQARALAASADIDSAKLWHERLGHLNIKDMQLLAAMEGTGVRLPKERLLLDCDTCQLSKARKQPHPPKAALGADTRGHTFHVDRGEFGARGLNSSYYMLLWTDEATKLMVAHCTTTKRDAVASVEQLREELLVPDNLHLHCIKCDGAGDLVALREHGARAGFEVVRSPPHTPESNGIAERAIQEVKKVARCFMEESQLPRLAWPLAVQHAVYVINRRPTKALGGGIPYEAWHGKVPDLSRLRKFGCYAFVRAEGAERSAHTAGWRGRYVGHAADVPGAYLIYRENIRQVITTRNVTFMDAPEEVAAQPRADTAGAADGDGDGAAAGEGAGAAAGAGRDGDAPEPQRLSDGEDNGGRAGGRLAQPQRGRAQEPPAEQQQEGQDLGPGRTRSGQSYTPADLAAVVGEGVAPVIEPTSYREACGGHYSGQWRAAMEREYSELQGHGTWELVPAGEVPAGAQVLDSGWAYKDKGAERPEHTRFKARIVARGCQQRDGSYGDAFAPTADVSVVRALLATAAAEGWEVRASDVHNAFCQSELPRPVYMRQPQGFVQHDDDGKPLIMRLRKSLYGLHESANLWHATMRSALLRLGYEPSPLHDCVYKHPTTGVIQVVYVDDNLHTGVADAAVLQAAIDELAGVFSLRDLGFPSSFLGMELARSSDGSITLTQHGYTQRVLEAHDMAGAHGVHTPAAGAIIDDDRSPPLPAKAAAVYIKMVGELLWLARCTRLDIAFTVSQLQKFVAAPRTCHMEAAKRVLRYLAAHPAGITYAGAQPGGGQLELTGYADASFAADLGTRRSHTGYVLLLSGAAVVWRSKQQSLVTLSTAEAEYVALCSAAKDAVALAKLLGWLGFKQGPVKLLEDNAAAIRLAQDPAACKRTKHIDVQYHFVREQVQAGYIAVEAVSTDVQHADVLTKPLGGVKHNFHAATLMGSG